MGNLLRVMMAADLNLELGISTMKIIIIRWLEAIINKRGIITSE